MKKSTLALLIIILFSFGLSFYFYPKLPDQVATHWNIVGEADGYSSKTFGIFFGPILLILLFGLFQILPKMDPLKENFAKFRNYFDLFIILFFLFLTYLQTLVIYWNLGNQFDFIRFLVPAFAVLFFYIGIMLEKSKRNWFLGIRTPWTMSSDIVWDKTHKVSSQLFKISAICSLGGLVFPDYAMWFLLLPLVGTAIFAFLYSYFVYKEVK